MADKASHDMSGAVAKWNQKKLPADPETRRTIRRTIAGAVDKRSLRATGRNQQWNVRTKPETKALADKHRKQMKITLGAFVELAILAYVGEQV